MPAIGLESPVGGLNGIDSVDSMPPTDAIVLDNWVPRSGYLQSRPGVIQHAGDLGGPVETLTAYKGTQTFKLVAGANGKLIDVTGGGTGADLGTGYTNDRWQSAMINDRLILVNGADPELAYDGATLTPLDYTGSNPAITPGEFVGVTTFKGRAYYWKETGTSFWYAEAGSYQGVLEPFDLGPVLQLGGNIKMMFSWTVDTGTGPDDMLCIVTNIGELILYQGDDPGNVGFFEQVGRFEMPDPLSIRGHMKYGSDVILMTRAGYVNLTTVLREDQVSDYPAFSRKIARLVFDTGSENYENYGHECIQTDGGFLIFNVPLGNDKSQQFVRNAATNGWCRFTNWNAISFQVFNNETYWSGYDGYVYKIFGNSDNGEAIILDALPAYQYLGDQGQQKQITAAQVLTTHPDPKLIGLTGFSDFTIPQLSNTQAPPGNAGSGPFWNAEDWNSVTWSRSGGQTAPTTKGWQNVHAFGFAVTVAVQMQIATQEVIWRQTGWRFRNAGAQ